MDNNPISRIDKLKAIGLDESLTKRQLSDKILDEFYNKFMMEKKKNSSNDTSSGKQIGESTDNKAKTKLKSGTHIKKPKNPKIDKNDGKYIITLQFLNALLTVLNKDNIDDIIMFKDIKRDDLLKPECNAVLEDYLEKLTKQFGKIKLRYRRRNNTKNYIITIIKCLSSICGYTFKSYNHQTVKKINTNEFQCNNLILYSIYDV